MNGYTTNGFTQSLNGILTISDGLGTTIENGNINTNDITGDDIISNTVTTNTITAAEMDLTGNLNIAGTTDFTNTTDTSSLIDTVYAVKIKGGVIVEKNTYATDVMTNNVATGNIGCGNLNSSNGVNCVSLKTTDIICKSIIADDIFFKRQICGYINLGIAPYLKIPLTVSLMDTIADITNFNISNYLTNANNNTIFLFPYYNVIFYNDNNILCINDNSYGLSPLFYERIIFTQDLICTKILIQYKNMTLL